MFIVNHRRIFFALAIIMVLASWIVIGYYGLNLGTDFKGGSILELVYTGPRPDISILRQEVGALNLGQASIQPAGERGVLLRLTTINATQKEALLGALSSNGTRPLEEKRFSSIGPVIGQELARRGLIALIVVALLIIAYIAFVFRKVSHSTGGVSSWKYGAIAVLALVHDVSIPTGIFAVLGHYYGTEIDALFLTALLTILGLSVNDTIVVFDRIRENLQHRISPNFAETVGQSLKETFARSLITSLAVIFVLLAIYFYGGSTTRDFALVMSLGMFFGTYSSIFIAAPLLVTWQGRRGAK